jgi:hypothetical protein
MENMSIEMYMIAVAFIVPVYVFFITLPLRSILLVMGGFFRFLPQNKA